MIYLSRKILTNTLHNAILVTSKLTLLISSRMNVTELARKLHIHPKELLEILPAYGFDIGKKAIKIDNKVAQQIIKKWRFIKRELDEKKLKELEDEKNKAKELRKEQGITIYIGDKIIVRDLADSMQMPVTQLITELMKNGILANMNQNIDFDTAAVISEELGFSVSRLDKKNGDSEIIEDILANALLKQKNKIARPPVIVVMGHVDHGKTKLLDTIRQTNIIDTESGGITQHIGAYQTTWKDPKTGIERDLTFIDTPGHEAFTVMRSRGAKVADIAILVVAADDGVNTQTKEVIQIIKAAKLPFVVAINKIDKEGADIQKVKTELSHYDIIPEDWGGNVPMVEISAKEKLNIDKLLDVLLLVGDMSAEEITADASGLAAGTVIESHVDKGMGPVATVLVQAGTLKKNDPLVFNGEIYGKVRAMKDHKGNFIDEATPSVPAQIIGFKVTPRVGDILDVGSAAEAKLVDVKSKKSEQTGAETHSVVQQVSEDDEKKKTLNLIIKADVLGSLEAIIGTLETIQHDEVGVKIIGKGLGNITDDDIARAESGNGTIIGFNVKANLIIAETLREKNIPFFHYSVIYALTDWVKVELEKLLEHEMIVTELGIVKILAVFRTDKNAMTIGGRVEEGKILKNAKVRIKRAGEIVGIGKLTQIQSGKSEVKSAPAGTECGMRYEGKTKIEVGDVFEAYSEESKIRKIEFK